MDRRRFLGTAVFATASALSAGTSATASASTTWAEPLPATAMSDADLDRLIKAFENLPERLKNADPKSTPNFERELSEALHGMKVGGSAPKGMNTTQGSWWQCGLEVAQVIISYGIPVAKVLKWIKQARKLYGSVKGIWNAIRHGTAAAEIGEDGAKILEAILGFDGVINACFS